MGLKRNFQKAFEQLEKGFEKELCEVDKEIRAGNLRVKRRKYELDSQRK